MSIGVILQARMSSTRLPGKVLKDLNGRPLLSYIVERLKHATTIKEIIVATSTEGSDEPIAAYCHTHQIPIVRGELKNVVGRFQKALNGTSWKAFIRVCGDSPFLDQALIDEGVKTFLSGTYDVVTNVQPRSFPKGESVEIFSTRAFLAAVPKITAADDQEHVGSYFYKRSGEFKIKNFSANENCHGESLVVDTEADFQMAQRILRQLPNDHWVYPWQKILALKRLAA